MSSSLSSSLTLSTRKTSEANQVSEILINQHLVGSWLENATGRKENHLMTAFHNEYSPFRNWLWPPGRGEPPTEDKSKIKNSAAHKKTQKALWPEAKNLQHNISLIDCETSTRFPQLLSAIELPHILEIRSRREVPAIGTVPESREK